MKWIPTALLIMVLFCFMRCELSSGSKANMELIMDSKMYEVNYKIVKVDSLDIFYREAGNKSKPALLLLHGFPSSSHMFRNLIPLLSARYHVIAPDFPGFGLSSSPEHTKMNYTFDKLAAVLNHFTDAIELKRFAIYVFDYGAPLGFRLALKSPQKITGIISQNGNAYEQGLSDGWSLTKKYWYEPTEKNRNELRSLLTLEGIKFQYTSGVLHSKLSKISPDGYYSDFHFINRPGNAEIQLDLFLDYKNNVILYPKFHEYFRRYKPKFLAVWGRNDPFFLPEGATCFTQDIPDARIKFYETGHFSLETHVNEIAKDILDFMCTIPQ